MCLLGCDIGSSSVKASIVDKDTGLTLASDFIRKKRRRSKPYVPDGQNRIRMTGGCI